MRKRPKKVQKLDFELDVVGGGWGAAIKLPEHCRLREVFCQQQTKAVGQDFTIFRLVLSGTRTLKMDLSLDGGKCVQNQEIKV